MHIQYLFFGKIFVRMIMIMMMVMMMMNCFVVGLTDERRLALFPAGIIVKNPHHRESPTRREQDLHLSSGFAERSCAVVITTTP